MKGRTKPWVAIALIGMCSLAFVYPTFAQANGEVPVLIGPIEAVDAQAGTIVVLGQQVLSETATGLQVGDLAEVFGALGPNGIVASKISPAGPYVPGATPVLITGVVSAVNSSLGRATVGNVEIDYSPSLSSGFSAEILVGSTVQLGGLQPAALGLVLSGDVVILDGIIGGGISSQGIIGGGKISSQGIIGGGRVSTQGIIGGGRVSTQGIIGGGKLSTAGIIGGG
jgi:hypothetical protein